MSLTLFFAILVCVSTNAFAQFPAQCDQDKSCVGNALTISVTRGKGAQYVDVDTSYRVRNIDSAITFEAWIKPEAQPGMVQYIAGLWGPNKDNNDVWVVFVKDTKITFELSKDNSYKGDTDNTIVTADVPTLYTKGWTHISAVWDAKSTMARLYVDGVFAAQNTNVLYPVTVLHKTDNPSLPMQIGSCNALYDDTSSRRTFLGQIDEMRLWNRALNPGEIACQRLRPLVGNEPGLILYYRFNEPANTQFLCDATGHDVQGKMRSGAHCEASDRKIPQTLFVNQTSFGGTIKCVSDTTFQFTITDTSFCGDGIYLGIDGRDKGLFTISNTYLSLAGNIAQTVTISLHAILIGEIDARIWIVKTDFCGDAIYIPIKFNRTTELTYSSGQLALDTLYVGCASRTTSQDTLQVCNNTGRNIQITNVATTMNRFALQLSPAITFPHTLKPGECLKVISTMVVLDSSNTLFDTVRVFSDEICPGSGIIPIQGTTKDVLGVLRPDGKTVADSMHFEDVCPGQISGSQTYQFRSLASDNVSLDTIVFPPAFFGFRFGFPITLPARTAFQATFVRFRPDRPGPFAGDIVLYATYNGCKIQKKIHVTGRGISVDVKFTTPNVLFGNVTIGKIGVQTASVLNFGTDKRSMSSYLKVGDVFRITAGKAFGLDPGQTQTMSLDFRPRENITYYDTLCVFDEQCYQTICIPVSGTGVFQSLRFDPPYLALQNVIGCESKTGTITVQNISGGAITIVSDNLNDPSTKFSTPDHFSSRTFANNATFTYRVTYTPNDLALDRADDAYIDIVLADGQIYHLLLRGTSLAPRLYVTPLTTYGTVEAGWTKRDSILIENASVVPIDVKSITLPPGYKLIKTFPALPFMLPPRDSLWVVVEFAPTADQDYNGAITVTADAPCTVDFAGILTGRGQAVKLQVPISFMNFSLVKPCDCALREISLPNYSNLIPITIDSIWIDGPGVTPTNPSTFHWKLNTGSTTVPFTIVPQQIDTLDLSFCPNIPAINSNFVKNDVLHIKAHTPGWSETFETLLSGRRELNFQPESDAVDFPSTRVDTGATPIVLPLLVPDVTVNPDGDSVIIDHIGFKPDKGVFSAVAKDSSPLPWIIKRGEKKEINVNFFPRAPKTYVARMQIHTLFPCNDVDTTVLVTGTGFAPAFGLQIAFDTAKIGRDTINLTTCDTLVLPIMTTRPFPQDTIDTYFHIGYDSTQLKIIDVSSPFTTTTILTNGSDGAHIILKNSRFVKSGYLAYVRFAVIGVPGIYPINIDQIDFDSDSLVFFKIIAGIDKGWIRIDQPQIAITKRTNFDTVKVRDCKTDTIIVRNPGRIPVRFDSIGYLPRYHKVIKTSIPYPTVLKPNDSIIVYVQFCPHKEILIDTPITASSNIPCKIADTSLLHSFGWAPPYPYRLRIGPVNSLVDSVVGRINDTTILSIRADTNMPQTPIDIRFSLNYDTRVLDILSASSKYGTPVWNATGSGVTVALPKAQNVGKGEIASFRFVFAVPDSIHSTITLVPGVFTSDSDFFITPVPLGDTSHIDVGPRCSITRLEFRGGSNNLSAPMPNPSKDHVSIDAEFMEDANVEIRLYSVDGSEALTLKDGSSSMKGGKYHLVFNTAGLSSGTYYLRVHAGSFIATRKLSIQK